MLKSERRRIKGIADVKARRQRHLDQGLCGCGRERKPGTNQQGKPEARCQRCFDAQKRRNLVIKPSSTGNNSNKYYRVIKTGKVGKLMPCESDDPLILDFKDGSRDVFHLKELKITTKSKF